MDEAATFDFAEALDRLTKELKAQREGQIPVVVRPNLDVPEVTVKNQVDPTPISLTNEVSPTPVNVDAHNHIKMDAAQIIIPDYKPHSWVFSVDRDSNGQISRIRVDPVE